MGLSQASPKTCRDCVLAHVRGHLDGCSLVDTMRTGWGQDLGSGSWGIEGFIPLAPLGRGVITVMVRRGLRKSPARIGGGLNLPLMSQGWV